MQVGSWETFVPRALPSLSAHRSSWLSSQNGGDLVRLQVQNIIGRERVAVHSSGSKPVPIMRPSQNGWLLERPQRHHQ